MKAPRSLAALGLLLASLPLAVLGTPLGPVVPPKPIEKRALQLALNTNFPDPSIEQVLSSRSLPLSFFVFFSTTRGYLNTQCTCIYKSQVSPSTDRASFFTLARTGMGLTTPLLPTAMDTMSRWPRHRPLKDRGRGSTKTRCPTRARGPGASTPGRPT